MNRAVLPHMKANGRGLLITISSLTARLALPFQGPYGASKWAVEALAELYRMECSALGIESCIVEPGGMPTVFIDRLMQPGDTSRTDSYGAIADLPGAFLKSFEDTFAANPEQHPRLVADAITQLIDSPHGQRPFRTIVDRMVLGAQVRPYNAHAETITAEVYASFGISHLLQVKAVATGPHALHEVGRR
jgi:NAD(P)-dependent dehydrogenase (short-subunit alcohol dehydrogenase family)